MLLHIRRLRASHLMSSPSPLRPSASSRCSHVVRRLQRTAVPVWTHACSSRFSASTTIGGTALATMRATMRTSSRMSLLSRSSSTSRRRRASWVGLISSRLLVCRSIPYRSLVCYDTRLRLPVQSSTSAAINTFIWAFCAQRPVIAGL